MMESGLNKVAPAMLLKSLSALDNFHEFNKNDFSTRNLTEELLKVTLLPLRSWCYSLF